MAVAITHLATGTGTSGTVVTTQANALLLVIAYGANTTGSASNSAYTYCPIFNSKVGFSLCAKYLDEAPTGADRGVQFNIGCVVNPDVGSYTLSFDQVGDLDGWVAFQVTGVNLDYVQDGTPIYTRNLYNGTTAGNITTLHDNSMAIIAEVHDNTDGTPGTASMADGTWTVIGTYNNIAGEASLTLGYKIQATAGATSGAVFAWSTMGTGTRHSRTIAIREGSGYPSQKPNVQVVSNSYKRNRHIKYNG